MVKDRAGTPSLFYSLLRVLSLRVPGRALSEPHLSLTTSTAGSALAAAKGMLTIRPKNNSLTVLVNADSR